MSELLSLASEHNELRIEESSPSGPAGLAGPAGLTGPAGLAGPAGLGVAGPE
jgi:hypothetical protein